MFLIHLKDITEEGQNYVFQSEQADSKELKEVLKDLVGGQPFRSEVHLRRLNTTTFEMKGFIDTGTQEQCSRCAEDFVWKVHEVFKELLVPKSPPLPREGKQSKVNHFHELVSDQPQVQEYENDVFDLGGYLREVIALACPFNPAPPVDAEGKCSLCHLNLKSQHFNYDEDFEQVNSPFSVLKNLKLN